MDVVVLLKALQERCAEEADSEAIHATDRMKAWLKGASPGASSEFDRGARRSAELCANHIREINVESWLIAHGITHGMEVRPVISVVPETPASSWQGLVSKVVGNVDDSTVQCDAEGRVLGRCSECGAPGIVVTPDVRIRQLEDALRFYANKQNWTSEVDGRRVILHRMPKHESTMDKDQGAVARATLEDAAVIACTMLPDQSGTWCGRKVVDGETVFSVPATDGPIKNCRVCIASMCRPWLKHAKSRKEPG